MALNFQGRFRGRHYGSRNCGNSVNKSVFWKRLSSGVKDNQSVLGRFGLLEAKRKGKCAICSKKIAEGEIIATRVGRKAARAHAECMVNEIEDILVELKSCAANQKAYIAKHNLFKSI